MDARKRIEQLRNLRTGYESVVSAVGFWQSLHGEDLIEEYARVVGVLERVIAEADVIGDDPYSDLYIERLGVVQEVAREALRV